MDQTDPARDRDPLRHLAEAALARQETAQRQRADDQAAVDRDQADQAEAADQAHTLAEAQQLAAEVFGAEGAELAAGLTWTAVGTGQATATIDEHVLVYHRTPVLWTRARAANNRLGGSWWPTSDGTRPTGYRKPGPSLGLLLRCGCGQQLESLGSQLPPSGAHERNDDGVQHLSPTVMVARTRDMLAAPPPPCSC
jgi:hypothetical protein